VPSGQYRQFKYYPYALTIGKIFVNNNETSLLDFYVPPCYSISAHPDLISLLESFDVFLSGLERHCTLIVQSVFQKKQETPIAQLVLFLCDRVMLYMAQALTEARWTLRHQSPAALFMTMASLARIIKNTIDLRIGSGKEELMGYLSEWCDLNQGEFESMLVSIANMTYEHNDVNKNISESAVFVRVLARLFEALSKLDLIGKRKAGYEFVVKEDRNENEAPKKGGRASFLG
jgi:hypothetical protein